MSGSFSYDQYPLYRDYEVCCTQRKETNSLCVSGTQERIEEMYSTCQGSRLQESAVATAVDACGMNILCGRGKEPNHDLANPD
jgi:hypothetical protein